MREWGEFQLGVVAQWLVHWIAVTDTEFDSQ